MCILNYVSFILNHEKYSDGGPCKTDINKAPIRLYLPLSLALINDRSNMVYPDA